MNYRLIATVRVKNESWILETWLRRTADYADGIIALDDGSTDDSVAILRSCPKVIEIICKPQGGSWVQLPDRNRLLEVAREHGAEWVHVIDPDEIMDERLADNLDRILSDRDAGRHFFKEVTLWRSTSHYRIDHPENYHRSTGTNQILRLTPQLRWGISGKFSRTRRLVASVRSRRWVPAPKAGYETLMNLETETRYHDDLVRLHYHFVDWNHAWWVHLRYAVREAIQMRKRLEDIPEIVDWATARLDETGLELAPVKPEWGVLPLEVKPHFRAKRS